MAPKRRGRPPIDADDPSVPVTVALPSRTFDELSERARHEVVSLPEIIRRNLSIKYLKNRQKSS